jgi:hypothetical protein
MSRWLDAGQRIVADKTDRAAWDEFVESGHRLGIIVPLPDGLHK